MWCCVDKCSMTRIPTNGLRTVRDNCFFFSLFPGAQKKSKIQGATPIISFFSIAIIYFQSSRKKVQNYTPDFPFFLEKSQKLYYFGWFLVIFHFFYRLPLFISAGPEKIENARANFFSMVVIYFRRAPPNRKKKVMSRTVIECLTRIRLTTPLNEFGSV